MDEGRNVGALGKEGMEALCNGAGVEVDCGEDVLAACEIEGVGSGGANMECWDVVGEVGDDLVNDFLRCRRCAGHG